VAPSPSPEWALMSLAVTALLRGCKARPQRMGAVDRSIVAMTFRNFENQLRFSANV
jgi:hypothetical protein